MVATITWALADIIDLNINKAKIFLTISRKILNILVNFQSYLVCSSKLIFVITRKCEQIFRVRVRTYS